MSAQFPALHFPEYPDLQIQYHQGKPVLFDPIRRKKVAASPEEWVRQHLLRFLLHDRQYPRWALSVEMGLILNGMIRRCDLAAFSPKAEPLLIAECKATHIPLSNAVFEQIAAYNLTMHVPYLLITNGLQTQCCYINYHNKQITFLQDIPFFNDLRVEMPKNAPNKNT